MEFPGRIQPKVFEKDFVQRVYPYAEMLPVAGDTFVMARLGAEAISGTSLYDVDAKGLPTVVDRWERAQDLAWKVLDTTGVKGRLAEFAKRGLPRTMEQFERLQRLADDATRPWQDLEKVRRKFEWGQNLTERVLRDLADPRIG